MKERITFDQLCERADDAALNLIQIRSTEQRAHSARREMRASLPPPYWFWDLLCEAEDGVADVRKALYGNWSDAKGWACVNIVDPQVREFALAIIDLAVYHTGADETNAVDPRARVLQLLGSFAVLRVTSGAADPQTVGGEATHGT